MKKIFDKSVLDKKTCSKYTSDISRSISGLMIAIQSINEKLELHPRLTSTLHEAIAIGKNVYRGQESRRVRPPALFSIVLVW